VTERTVRRLWERYLEARERLEANGKFSNGAGRSDAKREAGQLRARLVINYSPLVKYVAGRVGARLPPGAVGQEDMVSWGILGLLDAIETYEPDHPGTKAKFETYAISKIRWAILDQLRSQDWVPRRLRARAREVERARIKLAQELRRPPTEAEIAEEADMELAEYHDFLEKYSRAHVASLEAHLEADGGPGIEYGALVGDPSAIDPQFRADSRTCAPS
jgi:RNA polymerase sigma factor for flagellar operon FliA